MTRTDGNQAVRLVTARIQPSLIVHSTTASLRLLYASEFTGYVVQKSTLVSAAIGTSISNGTNAGGRRTKDSFPKQSAPLPKAEVVSPIGPLQVYVSAPSRLKNKTKTHPDRGFVVVTRQPMDSPQVDAQLLDLRKTGRRDAPHRRHRPLRIRLTPSAGQLANQKRCTYLILNTLQTNKETLQATKSHEINLAPSGGGGTVAMSIRNHI